MAADHSSASDRKRFVSPENLNSLAEELAFQVAKADFRPTFLIALWRGGCQPGAVVQEFLEYVQKTKIDHVAVRTISRDAITGVPLKDIIVHATGHACDTLTADSRLLIVDDVWDSGRSIQAVLDHLSGHIKERMPREIKVATVFYKPKRNKLQREPEFYVEPTDEWLVFPHELVELSDEEVAKFRPNAFKKAQELLKTRGGKR
jgi:hypoxanthine phosphoribosyltransferase